VTIAVAAAALPAAGPIAGATGCPCSLFAGSTPDDIAPGSFELGVRIEVTVPTAVTAIRFWKAAGESGVHAGRVWTDTGAELAQVAFTAETASGWQKQTLTSPLTLLPGSVYIVSVGVNNAYVATIDGLAGQVSAGPLQTAPGPNGVYAANGDFPTSTWLAQNYFVDVVATPLPVPDAAPAPAAGSTGLPSSTRPSATFSRPMNAGSVIAGFTLERTGGGAVAAAVSYDAATRTATLVTSAPLLPSTSYTARLLTTVASADGVPLASPLAWNFVTAPAPAPAPAPSAAAPPQVAEAAAIAAPAALAPQVVPFPADELSVVIVKTPSWRTVATSSRRTWVSVEASGAKPARMQLAAKVARPWAWRSYLSAFSFRTRTPTIWARFALTDDTVTAWHRISLKPKRR
jgi:hypothetical protein